MPTTPVSTLKLAAETMNCVLDACTDCGFELPSEKAGRVLLTAAMMVLHGEGISLADVQDSVARHWDAMNQMTDALDDLSNVAAEPFKTFNDKE